MTPMRRALQHPARLVPLVFMVGIALGTVLLMLPASKAGAGHAPFITALFTATSAVCVTGLTTVDTPTYWSGFGHAMITALTQIGGFGIITAATLLALAVTNRLGIRTRLLAQAEGRSLGLANVRQVLVRVGVTMLACEAVIAVVLAARFWLAYDKPFFTSLWYGVFHAVSSFNNAGFALYSDSLVGFVGDWWICIPIVVAIIAGGIGFPVLFELYRRARRPSTWSTHTRLTVVGSIILLVLGITVMLAFEWNNPSTLGPLSLNDKILAGLTQGSMPRSGGFSSVDYNAMNLETTAIVIALMFIGGGSASTAGGIKVTTFFLLAYVIWAEVKGEQDVVIGRRRMAESTQRLAISVALLAVGVVATGTVALIATAGQPVDFDRALFEVTSAFATVGLSMGLTPTLPPAAQVVLVILMFVGRVGLVTVAAALALTTRPRLYRYPEERPLVG
jgi:trk system potassium uptake protein TrkH